MKKGICSRILTPKQVGPICWFMASFVAMFYSQRSRKILLNASKTWNTKNELFTLLKHVLDDQYLKKTSSEDYEKFKYDTFGKILSLLYKENSKAFPYNKKTVDGGFAPINYIGKFFNLLNVDYKIYEYRRSIIYHNLYYSYMNEEFDNIIYRNVNRLIEETITPNKEVKYSDIEKKYKNGEIHPPQILIVNVSSNDIASTESTYFTKFPYAKVDNGTTKNELTSMREKITYHGVEYKLDSVILSNYNLRKNHGHAIAGITCKNEKYIYNGWTRRSMDPMMAKTKITRNIPCELMSYNWNIQRDNDFCLNTIKCIPDILKFYNDDKLCFNFGAGNRILIYVRKDATVVTSTEKEDDIQKYLDARAISEERKRALSEERKRALSEERKRALSEERKRALSLERKRALSEERRRALSLERKRAISEAIRRELSEEEKYFKARALSEERKRAISEERKRAIKKIRDNEINEIENMLSNLKLNKNLKRKRSNSISPKNKNTKRRRNNSISPKNKKPLLKKYKRILKK
jgi:hypothetical protein